MSGVRALLLILHLSGAVVAAASVVGAFVAVLLRRANTFRSLALAIAGIAVVQVVSGAALAYVSAGTVLNFCVRIGAYVALLALTEVVLLLAARRVGRRFPVAAVATSGALSLVATLVGALLLAR